MTVLDDIPVRPLIRRRAAALSAKTLTRKKMRLQ